MPPAECTVGPSHRPTAIAWRLTSQCLPVPPSCRARRIQNLVPVLAVQTPIILLFFLAFQTLSPPRPSFVPTQYTFLLVPVLIPTLCAILPAIHDDAPTRAIDSKVAAQLSCVPIPGGPASAKRGLRWEPDIAPVELERARPLFPSSCSPSKKPLHQTQQTQL